MSLILKPNQSQLFLDNEIIEDSGFLERVWHKATKVPQPVLVSDQPWEDNGITAYGSVLYWQGKFRIWYSLWPRTAKPVVCYAESADGFNWVKPELGIHEICGIKKNNVVLLPTDKDGRIDDIAIIDDYEDEEWPLKALYWDGNPWDPDKKKNSGLRAARSKDGINWEELGMVLNCGDRFNALSAKWNNKYIALIREPEMSNHRKGRVVSVSESENLKDWTDPELILHADLEDPALMEFYSATAFTYDGRLMGSIERMYKSPDKLDIEIIWADSPYEWKRSQARQRFIDWGLENTWDSKWTSLTSNNPILKGNNLWFYYTGRSAAHNISFPHNQAAVGLATLRRDGFASLKASEKPGYIQTKAIKWEDNDLLVNIDCRRDLTGHPQNTVCGNLKVEVRDIDNNPIEGFALSDFEAMARNTEQNWNNCCAPVKWKEKSIRCLAGRNIKLFFELKDTHFYSFRTGNAEEKRSDTPWEVKQ